MNQLDEFSLQEALEMYYEKHRYLKDGDMVKLLELKKRCPDIFDKEKEAQIEDVIEHAKIFQKSTRYKELVWLELKKRLSLVKQDE